MPRNFHLAEPVNAMHMTTPARIRLILALAAALLVVAAPAASAAPDGSAAARLAACRHSPSIDGRVATVAAWMRPLPTAKRLTLKLDLQQRQHVPGARWTPRTDVPGLGTWTVPSDALLGTRAGDVFKYRQAVGRLVLGYAYRFRVSFRWLDAAGAVVRESSVRTRACSQPGPDLVLTSLRTAPTRDPRLVRATLTVSNVGRAPAVRVVVGATPATGGSVRRSVGRLEPGESVVLSFVGPACVGGGTAALFTADPEGLVEEVDEKNNWLDGACSTP
jgi:hypothetical protein